MWINFTTDELKILTAALENHSAVFDGEDRIKILALIEKLEPDDRSSPERDAYRNAVETSDELEVDDDAIVSMGADPGAWVHAWVWVTNERAGIEEDEDENVCRTCGEEYPEGGDGFDGECPDCADKTDQKLHPEN
jgi:hypothetical protein